MTPRSVDLSLRDDLCCHGVDARIVTLGERCVLRVTLEERIARDGLPNVDYIDMRTFVRMPWSFRNGTLSVDVRARTLPDAPDYARGFAGLAWRITPDTFESVYLRPSNGLRTGVSAPRRHRAVQYFAHPDWRFERLRAEFPDGRHEAGAAIAPDEWAHLVVRVDESRVRVEVDDVAVLDLQQQLIAPCAGHIGLFVDIGTEAFFSDWVVEHA